jgi:hypothetical protein
MSGIVSVYQEHDFADEKRAAVEVRARRVEGLVSGGAAGNVVEANADPAVSIFENAPDDLSQTLFASGLRMTGEPCGPPEPA